MVHLTKGNQTAQKSQTRNPNPDAQNHSCEALDYQQSSELSVSDSNRIHPNTPDCVLHCTVGIL